MSIKLQTFSRTEFSKSFSHFSFPHRSILRFSAVFKMTDQDKQGMKKQHEAVAATSAVSNTSGNSKAR